MTGGGFFTTRMTPIAAAFAAVDPGFLEGRVPDGFAGTTIEGNTVIYLWEPMERYVPICRKYNSRELPVDARTYGDALAWARDVRTQSLQEAYLQTQTNGRR